MSLQYDNVEQELQQLEKGASLSEMLLEGCLLFDAKSIKSTDGCRSC